MLLKKSIYQSKHRGCKEMDIILGNFAEKKCIKMTSQELELYLELLQENDVDIYNWMLGESCHEKYTKLIMEIKKSIS
jgi:antitoxin CptB